MKAPRQVTVVFGLLLVGCAAASALLLRRLDQARTGATLEEVLYISSPRALKKMSLGYDGLLADIYWTRAVQYFGSKHHEGSHHFDQLAPLLQRGIHPLHGNEGLCGRGCGLCPRLAGAQCSPLSGHIGGEDGRARG